jgi:hypothetical protein
MSVYTGTVGCPACRDSASGHCAQHPLVASREGSEAALPSGQRRYYAENRPARPTAKRPLGSKGKSRTADFAPETAETPRADDAGIPSGDQPRAGDVELPSGDVESQAGDFELQIADVEPPARQTGRTAGPKAHPEPVSTMKPVPVVRRARPSKGWRRHLRRTKALARIGRSGVA